MGLFGAYDASTTNHGINGINGINGFGDSFSLDATEWSSIEESEDLPRLFAEYDEEGAPTGENHEAPPQPQLSEEDRWIDAIVEEIYNGYSTVEDGPLYDTSFDEPTVEDSIRSHMDGEIAMLVRCNERPDALLIEEGRAVSPLTPEEANDVSQLVVWNGQFLKATDFFKDAVAQIFREHAVPSPKDGVLSLDRAGIAAWMTHALRHEEEGFISQHDGRVLKTLSEFGAYGSGRLVEENFQTLYLRCLVGDASAITTSRAATRHLGLRTKFRDAVWRDIRAHGIVSPVEEERMLLVERLNTRDSEVTTDGRAWYGPDYSESEFVDECEILDWGDGANENTQYGHTSSHKLVEMANDGKTPLRIPDGSFVFIDEESCIGCMKCANIASSSFLMMESGRARTFLQRAGGDVEQAVDACPVSCMHKVSFEELARFETARDDIGRSKNSHTPLHVAGIDSDHNHRPSLYHTLKARCSTSSSCPTKGCYDCPSFRTPGTNPFFIAKHKQAQHVRAQHFIQNGEARIFRKFVDL